MTKIHVKGILGQIFGKVFNIKINNAISALKAIDANKNGFMKKLFELHKEGYEYYIVADNQYLQNYLELKEKRNIKNIYIIPALVGFGGWVAGLIVGAEAVAAGTLSAVVISSVVNALITSAISLGIAYISAQMNKQGAAPQQQIAVGGASATIQAMGKSYIFSNNQNIATQGSGIPVGYGKLRIPSKVINISVKNYSLNENFLTESSSSTVIYNSEFLTFT